MALITANVRSQIMNMETQVLLTMPDYEKNWEQNPPKIIYLLHGLSNNATAWIRGSNIDRYAQEKNFIVIMPEVQKSFYTDMVYGPSYFSYLTEELPQIISSIFGIKHNRENTFIAGLSMGGYGAFKAALNRPDLYKGSGSFSGALDLYGLMAMQQEFAEEDPSIMRDFQGMFGEDILTSQTLPPQDDIRQLFTNKNNLLEKEKPAFFMSCGTEDSLYGITTSMKNHIEALDYNIKYMESPGGHEWNLWDENIKDCLDFFNNL